MSDIRCISQRIRDIQSGLPPSVRLLAVSKFHSVETIREAYEAGQRFFAENRVQELTEKQPHLPADIEWHFIGHLQVNKVKYIIPFAAMIQSVDSAKIMDEINRCALKNNRKIKVLLQIHIALEEHKFGLSFEEAEHLLREYKTGKWPQIEIAGLMGMATFTDDQTEIRKEFALLRSYFVELQKSYFPDDAIFKEISMGMSDDYPIAIAEGSTMVRIGSKIFGNRA